MMLSNGMTKTSIFLVAVTATSRRSATAFVRVPYAVTKGSAISAIRNPSRLFLSTTPQTQTQPQQQQLLLFQEELNIIYDSKCNVCKLEIDWLAKRDARVNGSIAPKLKMTDIESDDYDDTDPSNGGISYEKGMAAIHAVTPTGKVMSGVPVFSSAYDKVGLGWLFAITRVPILNKGIDMAYDFFAKYRTNITRGSSLEALVESYKERKQLEAQQQKLDCEECKQ
jgi:predicted DCC family thiol-disulfide oxidoreductase YuxK